MLIADLLLRLLGENPAAYPHSNDKWPVILADLIDIAVPIVILLLFIAPLLIIKLLKKRFTIPNVIIALIIGSILAYCAWWLNEWSYGYGQAVIWRAINQ